MVDFTSGLQWAETAVEMCLPKISLRYWREPPPCKCYPVTKLRRAPYDVKNFGVVVLGPALESKKMMQKNIVFFLWGMHGVKNDLDCIKCFIQMENKCIMQIIMPDFQGSL